jgi:gliding motility-associated-like protein
MTAKKCFYLFCIVNLAVSAILDGQTNLDFNRGNFTNWTGYTWRYSDLVPSINTSPVAGIVDRRQTIMSDTTAYDANTGYALRKIPSGYLYSARLGDEITSADRNPRCWQQSLRYTMTVDSSNALLIFKFALVLQYASDHNATNEPRFKLTLYDSDGNTLPDCSNYDVYSSNKNIKGFKTYTPAYSEDPVEWRDWTTVGANLLSYIGQTITIEFMSADCTQKFHYGYAYFVAECHPLIIGVKYCTADTTASLVAPDGFEHYRWTNSSGTLLDTLQTLKLSVPEERSVYSCTMTSATGCIVTLKSSVVKYTPKANFNNFMLDCSSNTVQFTNLSTTNHGSLSYLWNFDNSDNTSTLSDPAFTFSTSGMHRVTLILANLPSTCTDTVTKDVESFSPPLVGIRGDSTYCPGLTTYLDGYGAYEYKWSTGSDADSIEAGSPGGTWWLLGYSSTGCVSDTIYKTVTEDPEWDLMINGDSTFCGRGSVLLSLSGAKSYRWNTGSTDDSINVSTPGIYTVTGLNNRGCEKSTSMKVSQYPVPNVRFTLEPKTISIRHSDIECTVQQEDATVYRWDLGDGTTGTGTDIQHHYSVADSVASYLVTLMATTEHNCTDSLSKYVDIVPFIPNVFSPNNDSVDDLFMPGYQQEIVDRSGMLIYKGSEGWDGRYNGKSADPDTYFYLVSYTDSKSKTHTRTGYLVLVR